MNVEQIVVDQVKLCIILGVSLQHILNVRRAHTKVSVKRRCDRSDGRRRNQCGFDELATTKHDDVQKVDFGVEVCYDTADLSPSWKT